MTLVPGDMYFINASNSHITGLIIIVKTISRVLTEVKILEGKYKDFQSNNPEVKTKGHACITTSTIERYTKIQNIMDLVRITASNE